MESQHDNPHPSHARVRPLLSPELPGLSSSGLASLHLLTCRPCCLGCTCQCCWRWADSGNQRADEGPALRGSCSAGTALGAATGRPGHFCLWKPQREQGMRREGSVLLPVTPWAQANCLNGLTGTGQRQFWCHPHTYVPVLPSRVIVVGVLYMLFKRCYWTHLTAEETEVTQVC